MNVPGEDGQCWLSLDFHVLQGWTQVSYISLCLCVCVSVGDFYLFIIDLSLCKVNYETHRNVSILFLIVIYNCKYIFSRQKEKIFYCYILIVCYTKWFAQL